MGEQAEATTHGLVSGSGGIFDNASYCGAGDGMGLTVLQRWVKTWGQNILLTRKILK